MMSGFLLLIACTSENSRTSLPAPPVGVVRSNPVADSNPIRASNVAQTAIVTPCPRSVVDSADNPDSDPPNDWTRFNDSIEVAELSKAQGRVCRVGSELRIRLLDGRSTVLKHNASQGEYVVRYAGYLQTIHSHVVHLIPNEGSGAYLIVDDSTGDSTTIYGKPVASPNGERFVVTSMAGEGAGYDASMIEVWRMVGSKGEKEFSYDTGNSPWEASDPVWRDSVTIDFLKNRFVSFSEPYAQTPARLKRLGTTWVLEDSLPLK